MKTFSAVFSATLALAFATESFAQLPISVVDLPVWWNAKKAKKKVRKLRFELVDKKGEPVAGEEVTLECSDGKTLTGTTNKSGYVGFRKKLPNGATCEAKRRGVILKRVDFQSYEPTTVGLVHFTVQLPEMKNISRKAPVKNQVFNSSATTTVKVFLYSKNKRKKMRWKNVTLTCLTNSGARKVFKDRSGLIARSVFEEVPYGSQCFIQVEVSRGQPELKGFVDLTETDHAFTNELRIHINADGGGGGGGGGGGNPPQMPSIPTPSINAPSVNLPSIRLPNFLRRNKNRPTPVPAPDPVEEPEQIEEATVTPAEITNACELTIVDNSSHQALAGKSITLYDPEIDASVNTALVADANGVVKVPSEWIVRGKEYLVFLGSDDAPIATRNVLSKIRFSENCTANASFDVGPLLYNFQTDISKLDITKQNIKELDQLAAYLKEFPNLRVVVEGHTDSDASERYNLTLSKNRAEAIKKYLVEKGGIEEERVKAEWYGESRLILNADGTENKAASRRTEVKPYWGE